jgi:hypothetical protein
MANLLGAAIYAGNTPAHLDAPLEPDQTLFTHKNRLKKATKLHPFTRVCPCKPLQRDSE